MTQYISPLANLKNNMEDTLLSNSHEQPSLLTSIANRNNITSYSQWVNNKFSPAGFTNKLAAKIMSPFCSNPVIGLFLLIGWIVFFIYITWYVTNGKCSDLSDDKLQKIAGLVAQQEIIQLDKLNSSLLSKFRSDIDMNMMNEQKMFASMTESEKYIYLKMPNNEKERIYKMFLNTNQ